jgi:soluble lytic murein transglycosylase
MTPKQQKEGAWRYWKARAWKVLGRDSDAEALFVELSREYNFYGQLAAEELGAAPASGLLSVSYLPTVLEIESMEAQPSMQRTLALYRMGLREEAAKEWSLAVRKLDDKQLLVASEIASRHEMYDRSINAADRTLMLHDFNLRYPAPYRENLQARIQENNLDEAWVYGLMRQESRFVTQAKSSVGAAGLMQVMPATARWIARRLGMKDYRKELISQLDTNLKLGTYYMKNVLSTFKNNPVLASAAYNAGPGRARQWLAANSLEGAIYVECIPFDETRDYVKKVMSNTVYYAKLFGQSAPSLKQRLGTIEGKSVDSQRKILNEL